MARTARVKSSEVGVTHYHLMSRTNNRVRLFANGDAKDQLLARMHRTAAFCGVKVHAFTAMDNHFHILVTVERPAGPVPTAELIRRFGILKGESAAKRLEKHWNGMIAAGRDADVEAEQNRLRARMNDISSFIKEFKESFDRWFKENTPYYGSIWSGRFKSTIVEDGRYFEICRRYILCNPIRAGIVRRIGDYRWNWCENDEVLSCDAGPVPVMRRMVQIGEGKVFGSESFVRAMGFRMGSKFKAKSAGAREVDGIGAFAIHGWKLAKSEKKVA